MVTAGAVWDQGSQPDVVAACAPSWHSGLSTGTQAGSWNEERKQNNCWTRKEIYSAPLFKRAFPQDCWALLAKCELWPPGTGEQELFWQLMETRGEGSEPGSAH